jgi:photosystem II stability/assembly factor-like uncharacterized protein
MREEFKMRVKYWSVLLSTFLVVAIAHPSSAQSDLTMLKDLSHIHHLEAHESKVLLGTHEGLFEYVGKGKVRPIGVSDDDFMGLTSDGKNFFRSGHPGMKSKLPNPVGLMRSTDNGKSWKSISLKGQVDFHFLESANGEIYGVDSGSGNLFYSQDSGEKWDIIGANEFSDIAISPSIKKRAFALNGDVLIRTNNSFGKTSPIKTGLIPRFIEWSDQGVFVASKNQIITSKNEGKSWQSLKSFSGQISALSISKKIIVVAVDNQIYISKNSGKSFLNF